MWEWRVRAGESNGKNDGTAVTEQQQKKSNIVFLRVMCYKTTGVRSEKFVISQFYCLPNITEYTYIKSGCTHITSAPRQTYTTT